MRRWKSWLGRWWSLLVVAAAVVPVTAFQPYRAGPPIRSDGVGYHIWTRAVLDGDLSFRRYKDFEDLKGAIYLADPRRDVYQDKYPPGAALIRFPVMACLVDRRPGAPLISTGEHWAALVLAALALLAVCFLGLRTAQLLGAPDWAANASLLALTFGTGLFHYGTYDACFSHVYSALGTALLVWLGVRAVVGKRARLPFLAVAAICFLFLLVRNTNVVILFFLTAAYFHARWRRGCLAWRGALRDLESMAAGAAAAAAVQLACNSYAHGTLVLSSYDSYERFLWDRPMQLAVLASYKRGLFTYYPVVAVVLACTWAVRRTRWAALWFSLAMLAYTALYGFWYSWTLGDGFGHRGFVELMPAGMILFAAALGSLSVRWRVAVCAAALLCTAVTLRLMLGYWQGVLPCAGADFDLYWGLLMGRW